MEFGDCSHQARVYFGKEEDDDNEEKKNYIRQNINLFKTMWLAKPNILARIFFLKKLTEP